MSRRSLLAAVVCVGCAGPGAGPPDDAEVRALVDGDRYHSIATTVGRVGDTIIVGSTSADIGALAFGFPDEGPGTYEISTLQTTNANFTTGTDQWEALLDTGRGTVTVEDIDKSTITGTFEFDLESQTGAPPATLRVTEGEFGVENPPP